jgi:hypothetical protein
MGEYDKLNKRGQNEVIISPVHENTNDFKDMYSYG